MTPPPENGLTVADPTDTREFYELMQAYRFAPIKDQLAVIAAYNAVRAQIRAWLAAQEPKDADARDAARYRWLRDNQTRAALKSTNSRNAYRAMDICSEAFGEQWDSLIDAAMAPPNTREGEAP